MPEPIKETVLTVARGGKAISSYVFDQAEAVNELRRIESNMRAAMLEPEVTLATVIKTTTYGDPKPVKARASSGPVSSPSRSRQSPA